MIGWDDNYYEQEPSCADEIFLEAKTRLVELIKESVKNDISQIQNAAAEAEGRTAEYRKAYSEACTTISELQAEVRTLKEDIARKRLELRELPFNIGDKVWVVVKDYSDYFQIGCATCNGVGKLLKEIDGVTYSTQCPDCLGYSFLGNHNKHKMTETYHSYRVKVDTVKEIIVYISEDCTQKCRYVLATGSTVDECDVYSNQETARLIAKERTYKEKESAYAAVGRSLQNM